jgi:hypothetical protein
MKILTKMKRSLVLTFMACVFAAVPGHLYAQQPGAYIAQSASASAALGMYDSYSYCSATQPNGGCFEYPQPCVAPCSITNGLTAESDGEGGKAISTTGATVTLGTLQAFSNTTAQQNSGYASGTSQSQLAWSDMLTVTSATSAKLPPGTTVYFNVTGTLAAKILTAPDGVEDLIAQGEFGGILANLEIFLTDVGNNQPIPLSQVVQAKVGDSIEIGGTLFVQTEASVGADSPPTNSVVTGLSSGLFPPYTAQWQITIDPITPGVCYTTASLTTYYTTPPSGCPVTTTPSIPTGETTFWDGWVPTLENSTVGTWAQTLAPASTDFNGRIVMETNANPKGGGGTDTCWFSGSMYPPSDQVTGGEWTVAANGLPNNEWGFDWVGLPLSVVRYYTTYGQVPCGTTVKQRMVINTSSNAGSGQYTPYGGDDTGNTNTLGFKINKKYTVTSTRAGQHQTTHYSMLPPEITSANDTAFSQGTHGSFGVTTNGTPAPSLTEAGTLANGVTFVDNGNGTGTLSGTPTVSGTFPITLTATNSWGTETQPFTLTVAPTSAESNVTSANDTTLTERTPGSFTVTSTGKPTPPATLPETGTLPSGVSFNDNGNGTGHFDVADPRPLAMAAQALESRFGWIITYEDPQWLANSEIRDVTESVRRDGSSSPRVLIPSGGSIEFDVLPAASDSQTTGHVALVQNLVLAHSAAGNPGTYRVQESHGRLNIVPLTAKDASERENPQQPVLDTVISLDKRQRNGLVLLDEFTEQLSRAAGVRVVVGTVPLNILAHKVGTYGAHDELARDFLSRFLDQTGQGFSWQLFFDPAEKTYALNIHRVTAEKGEE